MNYSQIRALKQVSVFCAFGWPLSPKIARYDEQGWSGRVATVNGDCCAEKSGRGGRGGLLPVAYDHVEQPQLFYLLLLRG
jgi:hypothetical protein